MEEAQQPPSEMISTLERVPEYLSIREAARILGVSERSVYGYVETGKLSGARIEQLIVVNADEVSTFERKAPGRVRTRVPRWRVPPEQNALHLTTITVRVSPGQQQAFAGKLEKVHEEGIHRFLGTVARYIVRSQNDPDEIEIILVWRTAIQPSEEQWRSALAALAADLSDVLAWDTAAVKKRQALLYA